MTHIRIYHNPRCGTSRNVLGFIRERGLEPEVIEYLKTPPTRDELLTLLKKMNLSVRDVLRQKGTPYDELGLGDSSITDAKILDHIDEHPILIQRPIVELPNTAAICRPSETVNAFLDEHLK